MKKKKKINPDDVLENKHIKAEEFTDRGSVYEEDPAEKYPEFSDEHEVKPEAEEEDSRKDKEDSD